MPAELDVRLSEGDHVVQFYERAEDHLPVVVRHLAGALIDGDAVVVVARPERSMALEAALAASGVDVLAARADGRFRIVDAQATLSEFMVGSMPDPVRFEVVVGGLVLNMLSAGRVRVYGEMVGLLWDAGNVSAAIELEDLWCGLTRRLPFSLFCGYDCSAPVGTAGLDAFAEVCDRHSAVIAAAPAMNDAEITRRFPRSPHAPRAARRFLAETLHGWDQARLVDDGALVVGELATNAVLHAQSDFSVGVSRHSGGVRLVVGDTSPAPPRVREVDVGTIGGRGLRLVAGLAAAWGHYRVAGGKVVWVDLGASPLD